jgi:ribonuclease HI
MCGANSMKLDVWFDGGIAKKTPTYGWHYQLTNERGELVRSGEECGLVSSMYAKTSNVAEWYALKQALRYILGGSGLINAYSTSIYGDSQLVIRQINGEYACTNKNIIRLYNDCRELKRKIGNVNFTWIPRDENAKADELAARPHKN